MHSRLQQLSVDDVFSWLPPSMPSPNILSRPKSPDEEKELRERIFAALSSFTNDLSEINKMQMHLQPFNGAVFLSPETSTRLRSFSTIQSTYKHEIGVKLSHSKLRKEIDMMVNDDIKDDIKREYNVCLSELGQAFMQEYLKNQASSKIAKQLLSGFEPIISANEIKAIKEKLNQEKSGRGNNSANVLLRWIGQRFPDLISAQKEEYDRMLSTGIIAAEQEKFINLGKMLQRLEKSVTPLQEKDLHKTAKKLIMQKSNSENKPFAPPPPFEIKHHTIEKMDDKYYKKFHPHAKADDFHDNGKLLTDDMIQQINNLREASLIPDYITKEFLSKKGINLPNTCDAILQVLDDESGQYTLHAIYKDKILGSGSFGCVGLMQDLQTGKIETFKKVNLISGPEAVIAEASNLADLGRGHPQVVFENMGRAFILMDYAAGKEMTALYNESKENTTEDKISRDLTIAQTYQVMIDIMKAISIIHEEGYLHCDIKLANIRIQENTYHVKLLDFGLMLKIGCPSPPGPQGTPFYMAPEIYSDRTYSKQTDIWALGRLLDTLFRLNDYNPQNNLPMPNLNNRFAQRNELLKEQKPDAPYVGEIEELRKLISDMNHQDPKERPALQTIIEKLEHMKVEHQLNNVDSGMREKLRVKIKDEAKKMRDLFDIIEAKFSNPITALRKLINKPQQEHKEDQMIEDDLINKINRLINKMLEHPSLHIEHDVNRLQRYATKLFHESEPSIARVEHVFLKAVEKAYLYYKVNHDSSEAAFERLQKLCTFYAEIIQLNDARRLAGTVPTASTFFKRSDNGSAKKVMADVLKAIQESHSLAEDMQVHHSIAKLGS